MKPQLYQTITKDGRFHIVLNKSGEMVIMTRNAKLAQLIYNESFDVPDDYTLNVEDGVYVNN